MIENERQPEVCIREGRVFADEHRIDIRQIDVLRVAERAGQTRGDESQAGPSVSLPAETSLTSAARERRFFMSSDWPEIARIGAKPSDFLIGMEKVRPRDLGQGTGLTHERFRLFLTG